MKQLLSIISIVAFAVFSGCTQVGPKYTKLHPQNIPQSFKESNSSVNTVTWWKQFHDPVIDGLVQEAYNQNIDIRSAGLRILQARSVVGFSKGLEYPQLQSLSGGIAASRNNGNNFINTNLGFDIGWEIDFWGRYAKGIDSSEALLLANMTSYDDVMNSVVAEVVRNYINYTTALERLVFAKRNIAIQERVVRMTEVQHNAGNVSELDVQQAKTQLYTTKSLLPGFKLAMIQARNALSVLLATTPQKVDKLLYKSKTKVDAIKDDDYNSLQVTPLILFARPLHVDVKVLENRPDIKTAEYMVMAQTAKVGLTQTELYPHIGLFGTINLNTQNALGEDLSGASLVGVSAGPAFKWNIFQYDRIKDKVRYEDALLQQKINTYNQKVLRAVSEISNALQGYELTKEQLELTSKTIDATLRAYNISMTQYEEGMVSYQRLLTSVEKLTRNEDKYASAKGALALRAVAIYKALGTQYEQEREYIHANDKQMMQNRTDWGEYLK